MGLLRLLLAVAMPACQSPLAHGLKLETIPPLVACRTGDSVRALICPPDRACARRSGKILGMGEQVHSVQHYRIGWAGGETDVPTYDVQLKDNKACGRINMGRDSLVPSSLLWGEDTVKPWLDALGDVPVLKKLLVLPMRDFTARDIQRETNRGDASCLLPVLAARRYPKLRIIVWEELPELVSWCRRVLLDNNVSKTVKVSSASLLAPPSILQLSKFDAIAVLGSERPFFGAQVSNNLHPVMNSVRMVRQMLHDAAGAAAGVQPHVIPNHASIRCAPVAGEFLQGLRTHYGFDLSPWPVPREVPMRLNLFELRAELVAEPKDVALLPLSPDGTIGSFEGVRFNLEGRRADGLACWPSFRRDSWEENMAKGPTVLREYSPSERTAQLTYMFRKSISGVEDLTMAVEVKLEGDGAFDFRIKDLLYAVSGVPNVNNVADSYHWWMLGDLQRGEAYDAALRASVRPGDYVIDIGAGSGLLSMMAVRAGAARVVSFEGNANHARLARKIVKHNKFGKRITTLQRLSTSVAKLKDIGASSRADVLVTEIFGGSPDGLKEGVVESINHAHRVLLKPNATVIPARLDIYGQLAEFPRSSANISGADVRSAYFDLQPHRPWQIVRDVMAMHELLSEPFLLSSIDFTAKDISTTGQMRGRAVASQPGVVHGVLMWFEILLDAEGAHRISNRPNGQPQHLAPFREEHWNTAMVPLLSGKGKDIVAPFKVAKGDGLAFVAHRGDQKVELILDSLGASLDAGSIEL